MAPISCMPQVSGSKKPVFCLIQELSLQLSLKEKTTAIRKSQKRKKQRALKQPEANPDSNSYLNRRQGTSQVQWHMLLILVLRRQK